MTCNNHLNIYTQIMTILNLFNYKCKIELILVTSNIRNMTHCDKSYRYLSAKRTALFCMLLSWLARNGTLFFKHPRRYVVRAEQIFSVLSN